MKSLERRMRKIEARTKELIDKELARKLSRDEVLQQLKFIRDAGEGSCWFNLSRLATAAVDYLEDEYDYVYGLE